MWALCRVRPTLRPPFNSIQLSCINTVNCELNCCYYYCRCYCC